MKIRKNIFLLFLFYSYIPVFAQVDTAWVRRYNGPGNSYDVASALAVDGSGNVYVTGNSGIIKYSANGDSLWFGVYGGSELVLDDSGNMYVASGYGDYLTVKYAPNGDTLWVRRYNGPGNGDDVPRALAVDDSGNVYVTGVSYGSGTDNDYATIKYSPSGDTLWVRRYIGPGNFTDVANALAVDDSGNVYVTGMADYYCVVDSGCYGGDYVTVKYAPNGDTLWVRRYSGGNEADEAYSLALDDSGNLYVTGGSVGDYATIKYSPNGVTLWDRRYIEPSGGENAAFALVVDDSGNVYVTGRSYSSGTDNDYATIKYSPSGDTLWVRRYEGDNDDRASALAVDDSGNVYVTGSSFDYADRYAYDYETIKYSSAGNLLWVREYKAIYEGANYATALTVDGSGNVYVTGSSYGSYSFDYATIKYSPTAKGDMDGDGALSPADVVLMLSCVFLGSGNCFLGIADANCSGSLTPADVALELMAVFVQRPFPC